MSNTGTLVWQETRQPHERLVGYCSVGEAAFFGALFLMGIVSLSILGSRQLFWPESQIIRVGFGFWLMIFASLSFVAIGLSGLILRVVQTVASPELRSALAQQAEREHQRRSRGVTAMDELPNTPGLRALTDSPGERLSYRLAGQRSENWAAGIELFLRGGLEWFAGDPDRDCSGLHCSRDTELGF